MPLPLTSDLATIMNLDEFAVSATYQRKNAAGDTVIKLIFDTKLSLSTLADSLKFIRSNRVLLYGQATYKAYRRAIRC